MTESRIEALERMLAERPDDARARFGLALEYEKMEQWEEVVRNLGLYLASSDDEGNAWGRLARALRQLGRDDEAREAYRKGIAAANLNGHPTMALALEEEASDF